MPTKRIRDFLLGHPKFQLKIEEVIREGVLNEFPAIKGSAPLEMLDWHYLLLCASALARSEDGDAQRVALRLADTCLKLPSTSREVKTAAAIVLDVMANQRAEHLAVARSLIERNWSASLPLPLLGDQLKRHKEDSIDTADGNVYAVNRFQKQFWEALQNSAQVSASAPTSAGKSFILRLWVAETFRRIPNARVAVLVPTRALIQEFADEFGGDLERGFLKNVSIHTLPLDDSISGEGGHLCVFTQERLHILLGRSENLHFNLIIVDEAQKVGDGHRGVLLEQVLNECEERSIDAQVVYASPFVENPAYLMRNAKNSHSAKPVEREVTTVTQNLLFVSQQPRDSMTWWVSFENDERSMHLGSLRLPFRPNPVSKRLTMVALALAGENAGNLVYANGAADAEKYAQQLADGISEADPKYKVSDKRILELIKLIHKTVHKKYLLATTLRKGVAYHYGNMPLLIRTEIEALFRENVIKFLVCTGTLIEGVNLPCKAIFMRGPTKGRGHPMQAADFWNLAGRAGRWGKEFHGTIVCVDAKDPKVWKNPPPKRRVRQRIASSLERCLGNTQDLIAYVQEGYPIETSKDNPDLDYTLSYLFHLVVRDGDFRGASKEYSDTTDGKVLLEVLRSEMELFPLPGEIVFRHPGILPAALLQLLNRLSQMSDGELIALSPVQPEAENAVEAYLSILRFINHELRANWAVGPASENRLKQLAYLTVDWMKGKPLAVLIRTREKVEEWRGKMGKTTKSLPSLIIEVMSDVETYARFKIPKYLRAYLDVLYFHAEQRGIEGVMLKLPDLELWLELGVSTRTQLAMMELGLSRTSCIELMEWIVNTDLTKESVLNWLKAANLDGFDLPGPVAVEVKKVLDRY